MRIQHNIMAMNAYRNYNANTKAIAKNLEKLSSGYRINRAGDDAAGLAISEKMRAQITGLKTAQKNAKDGISLIQTAEGALTEVHSMLNRMFELAEQSANGTYDNEVDRANLQKEFDALRSEIDRIADSSNFNGQKLLNGELDGTVASVTSKLLDATAYGDSPIANYSLGSLQGDLGTDKIILNKTGAGIEKTAFAVELNDLKFSGKTGDTITVTVGGLDLEIAATADDMDAADIVTAINTKYGSGGASASSVVFAGAGGVDQAFTLSGSGTTLTLTQTADPTSADEVVKGSMAVEVTTTGAAGAAPGYSLGGTTTFNNISVSSGVLGIDVDAISINLGSVTVSGLTGSLTDAAITASYDSVSKAILLKNGGDTIATLTIGDGAGFGTLTAASGASDADVAAFTFNGNDITVDLTTYTHAGTDEETVRSAIGNAIAAAISGLTVSGSDTGAAGTDGGITGTYSKAANDITEGVYDPDNSLASTAFTLTADIVKDGGMIELGGEMYIFQTEKESALNGYTGSGQIIDLTDVDASKLIEKAAILLTEKAAGNGVWDVGHEGGGKIKLTEITGQSVADLTTKENVVDNVKVGSLAETTTVVAGKGSALTLQIGDTADSYNMLQVSVSDMHCAALGIDASKININEQGKSQSAMDAIRNAINSVSSTRGDLGALQNRLDHTINNLGVMHENIQDAEATIRDTDVAEEMMAYTKNNILIQSAQAMLAQANQIPQGVLQLLG